MSSQPSGALGRSPRRKRLPDVIPFKEYVETHPFASGSRRTGTLIKDEDVHYISRILQYMRYQHDIRGQFSDDSINADVAFIAGCSRKAVDSIAKAMASGDLSKPVTAKSHRRGKYIRSNPRSLRGDSLVYRSAETPSS